MNNSLNEKDSVPFPRSGSVEYKFLLGDKQNQEKLLKTWKKFNKFFTIPLLFLTFSMAVVKSSLQTGF